MDEYQFEDFDDAPSRALVLSQQVDTSHGTMNDGNSEEQPSKRAKLSHGDANDDGAPSDIQSNDDNGVPSDTQLTQIPSDSRKIPGPAGSLPPMAGQGSSFPSKNAVVLANKENLANGLVIQSKLQRNMGHDVMAQDDYASDFSRGAWLVMLKHSELPPFGMLLIYIRHWLIIVAYFQIIVTKLLSLN